MLKFLSEGASGGAWYHLHEEFSQKQESRPFLRSDLLPKIVGVEVWMLESILGREPPSAFVAQKLADEIPSNIPRLRQQCLPLARRVEKPIHLSPAGEGGSSFGPRLVRRGPEIHEDVAEQPQLAALLSHAEEAVYAVVDYLRSNASGGPKVERDSVRLAAKQHFGCTILLRPNVANLVVGRLGLGIWILRIPTGAKVCEVCGAIWTSEQDVGGLDVSVYDSQRVDVSKAREEISETGPALAAREARPSR